MTAAALALLAALSPGAPEDGASPSGEEQALELFRTSCLACHAPPDLRFASDRAWLSQVKDTA